eukprot:3497098-Pleurochrysis_carterae.AAC.4
MIGFEVCDGTVYVYRRLCGFSGYESVDSAGSYVYDVKLAGSKASGTRASDEVKNCIADCKTEQIDASPPTHKFAARSLSLSPPT